MIKSYECLEPFGFYNPQTGAVQLRPGDKLPADKIPADVDVESWVRLGWLKGV